MGKRIKKYEVSKSEEQLLSGRQSSWMPNVKRSKGGATRKQLRKQARLEIKDKKRSYFNKEVANMNEEKVDKNTTRTVGNLQTGVDKNKQKLKTQENAKQAKIEAEEKLKKLQAKRRNKLLKEDNEMEERQIKMLEKRLKMNKRKSKTIPKKFVDDGLDDILNFCNPETRQKFLDEDGDIDSNFNEDFEIATGKQNQIVTDSKKILPILTENKEDSKTSVKKELSETSVKKKLVRFADKDPEDSADEAEESADDYEGSLSNSDEFTDEEDLMEDSESNEELMEMNEGMEDDKDSMEENVDSIEENEDSIEYEENKSLLKKDKNAKEDIYGRVVSSDGIILPSERYIPPSLRKRETSSQNFQQLKKQLKGLLNRLSESNMFSIVNEIEKLYMHHSRNDMTSILNELILEAIVQYASTPERLVLEHCMLISTLHANIGPEVGARMVEILASKFNAMHKSNEPYGNGKDCDNLLLIMVHLYTFKVVHSLLIYDILDVLANSFQEKCIEIILLILRCVGFSLRKDDPIRLKSFIAKVQTQARESGAQFKDQSRVQFMLDILMAIRNNNMHKIPNYDDSHREHLKKIIKTFIRKGNSISELKISLSDILDVESKGRWWIVGSSWKGKSDTDNAETTHPSLPMIINQEAVSDKVLNVARKLHINTDIRKNIFSVIMTADDYIDAFEKILKLSLKNSQERESIHVALECCLREKTYNPYYGYLLQKFCNHDRNFQRMVQYSIWDKLKELSNASDLQISNLSRLAVHLVVTKSLALTLLKVIEFSDINKPTVRFLRQTLIKLLFHEPQKEMEEIFSRVAGEKLRMFREGIRLFMRHFMLKNKSKLPEEVHENLELKIELAETALQNSDNITKF